MRERYLSVCLELEAVSNLPITFSTRISFFRKFNCDVRGFWLLRNRRDNTILAVNVNVVFFVCVSHPREMFMAQFYPDGVKKFNVPVSINLIKNSGNYGT